MPVFTIKAKDLLAVEAIEAYRDLCVKYSLTDQADEVDEAIKEVAAWQQANPALTKMPDHCHVPTGARSAVAFTRLLDNPFAVPDAARAMVHQGFRALSRAAERNIAHLRWVAHPDDFNEIRMAKPASAAGDLIHEFPAVDEADAVVTFLSIRMVLTDEVPRGVLSLVVDGL